MNKFEQVYLKIITENTETYEKQNYKLVNLTNKFNIYQIFKKDKKEFMEKYEDMDLFVEISGEYGAQFAFEDYADNMYLWTLKDSNEPFAMYFPDISMFTYGTESTPGGTEYSVLDKDDKYVDEINAGLKYFGTDVDTIVDDYNEENGFDDDTDDTDDDDDDDDDDKL